MFLWSSGAAIVLALVGNSAANAYRQSVMRAQLHEQRVETERVVREWDAGEGRLATSSSSESSPEGWRMTGRIELSMPSDRQALVHFEVTGQIRAGKLAPIEIRDLGGEQNEAFLPTLSNAFKEKGWESVIRRMSDTNEKP